MDFGTKLVACVFILTHHDLLKIIFVSFFFFFFQTAENVIFASNLSKDLNGAEGGKKNKSQLRNWNKPTDRQNDPAMFVQQYSMDSVCERAPRPEQPV